MLFPIVPHFTNALKASKQHPTKTNWLFTLHKPRRANPNPPLYHPLLWHMTAVPHSSLGIVMSPVIVKLCGFRWHCSLFGASVEAFVETSLWQILLKLLFPGWSASPDFLFIFRSRLHHNCYSPILLCEEVWFVVWMCARWLTELSVSFSRSVFPFCVAIRYALFVQ